jgi:hypothetical protein
MLNEILSEYDKVREKDLSTKKSVKDIIKSIKNDLKYLQSEIEDISNKMEVNFLTQDDNTTETINNKINTVTSKIEEKHYLKNYNTVCNNFYANLTKLGKTMSKNLESENIENFNLYDYDKSLFYNVLDFNSDYYKRPIQTW